MPMRQIAARRSPSVSATTARYPWPRASSRPNDGPRLFHGENASASAIVIVIGKGKGKETGSAIATANVTASEIGKGIGIETTTAIALAATKMATTVSDGPAMMSANDFTVAAQSEAGHMRSFLMGTSSRQSARQLDAAVPRTMTTEEILR